MSFFPTGPLGGYIGAQAAQNPGQTAGAVAGSVLFPAAGGAATGAQAGAGAVGAVQKAGDALSGASGFLKWISTSQNWAHLGLLVAGGILVVIGILAFANSKEEQVISTTTGTAVQ